MLRERGERVGGEACWGGECWGRGCWGGVGALVAHGSAAASSMSASLGSGRARRRWWWPRSAILEPHDIDERASLPPAPINESAQLVLGLAILGLAAAVLLGLVRRRCSTQYRTVSSRTEAVGLPTNDERDSEEPEYL